MIYTIKQRKTLNALFIQRHHHACCYSLQSFAGCERMQLYRPPIYATRIDSVQRLEGIAAMYWLRHREPIPILVEITADVTTGRKGYDVNYLNPNNPNDIELVSRYLNHTAVYTVETIPDTNLIL